ncbi:MAG: helicase-exonuclease AddAB subunit AddA [Oscillospiraceae bacterium]|jgi:ATP-dependent helicase/nuclease subunit A|nr:helicase-exonuclease AddAB subunit AddA [Oscillospiraceae bacterium]
MAFEPSPEQRAVLEARGEPLLVSAGAGSGKTSVLVERLLSRVFDADDPCEVSEFLIITFTKAAAAELRFRIGETIRTRISEQPDNRRLRRQAILVRTAEIGTISSFCGKLVRENAAALGLSPDFRVAEEEESDMLKARAAERVLSARYESLTPQFSQMVDSISPGRDDKRLSALVLDVYAKLMSHPTPDRWLEEQLALMDAARYSDAGETLWGRYLLSSAAHTIAMWRAWTDDALENISLSDDAKKAFGMCFCAAAAQCDAFISAAERGWDAAHSASAFTFPKRGNCDKDEYSDLIDFWDELRGGMRDAVRHISCSSAAALEDLSVIYPVLIELFSVIRDFRSEYSSEKRRRRVLDFSDLEHYALALTTDSGGAATQLAREISERFKEIMIDEYQDVNEVQERILFAVSRGGRNRVMVGDVRQSIYSFRLADPSIFLQKYESYTDSGGEEAPGRRIILSQNFRSRENILLAVNDVFSAIMSREFGGMQYTEREYLLPRRDAGSGSAVELDIINTALPERTESAYDSEAPRAAELEADFVAKRIREIIDGGFEFPARNGTPTRAGYGDVVILLRSMSGKRHIYNRALQKHGIPVDAPENSDFWAAKEIQLVMAFLQVIDNPRNDISLAAVLSSGVYGFMPEELADIRAASPDTDFYSALSLFAEHSGKAQDALTSIETLRMLGIAHTASEMLWRLFSLTSLPAIVSSWDDGAKRRRNIMNMITLAEKCAAAASAGMYDLLTYLSRMRELGRQPQNSPEAAEGAVRIMTIHKSKGLEFPIVILPDLCKDFKLDDTNSDKPALFHAQLGLGLMRVDLEKRASFPTPARLAIKDKLIAEKKAEELRIFYVAMTRAREKLIMTCSLPQKGRGTAQAALENLRLKSRRIVTPLDLIDRTSIGQMLLLSSLWRPEARALFGEAVHCAEYNGRWNIRKIDAADSFDYTAAAIPAAKAADDKLLPPRYETFRYAHAGAAELPSKLTVTQRKPGAAHEEVSADAQLRDSHTQNPAYRPRKRPQFASESGALTGSERGTAVHVAMKLLNFDKCATLGGVRSELLRLRDSALLTRRQFDAVRAESLLAFFDSELGKRALASEKIFREFKFSLLCPAREFFETDSDDEILFQGVVDLAFIENGELLILDFKTDRVRSESDMAVKAEEYAYQIRAYARAMERVTSLRVSSGALWFFERGTYVEISRRELE